MTTFEQWLNSSHPEIPTASVQAVVALAVEGATVPFIARYRKERTRNLDEVGIRLVIDAKERWDQLLHRQKFIAGEIEKQGKLAPELKDRIFAAFDAEALEDLYLPYKVKRRNKASQAREAGLEPLADWIWDCGHGTAKPEPGQTLELWAFTFRNEEKGIADAEAAIAGAQDLLVERLSESVELRRKVREALFERGFVRTAKTDKAKPNSKFEPYFAHCEPVRALLDPKASHRYLAMRRGWTEEELSLSFGGKPEDDAWEADLVREFEAAACTVGDSPGAEVLLRSGRLALRAHVLPSLENEAHKALKEVADGVAIEVFAVNLKKLLLAAPFGAKAVLGVDPGVRTGCKLAVVNDGGRFLADAVMYPRKDGEKEKAKRLVVEAVKTGSIRAVAVGNGTAGRETEIFVRAALKEADLAVPVVLVNEAGASVYSASDAAREEFPDLDVTVRGAISIARRLQDPLAELVKIDPKSIGVGQYQHDVSQPALKRSLDDVVDSCVNQVGVDLNTASVHLLSHVAGIGEALARAIVERRSKLGLFRARTELLEVPRLSKKAFEQAAGFLRIPKAMNPLDATGVHPERYEALESVAARHGVKVADLLGSGASRVKADEELRNDVGEYTFVDIVNELSKPGRDPREVFEPFSFRDDIFELKDLKPGMLCPGIVTNVTNFGAFVDIGVHQDGLVHISQLSDRFIKEPREAVNPGDRVMARVVEVFLEKSQIALSLKGAGRSSEEQRPPRREGRSPERREGESGRRDDRRPPRGPRHPVEATGSRSRDEKFTKGPRPGAPHGKPPRPVRPREAFNNPFGALVSLKKDLKPR